MTSRTPDGSSGTAGFSLIETLIVIVLVLIITGSIFQVVNLTMQRASTEQTKLDMFQEAREFMDQMARDLRQAGYPSPRNIDASVLTEDPIINDLHAAAGLVKVSEGDLWFEADVDGTGEVSVVQYHLDTSTTNNCPCLKRSQLPKVNGSPVTGQTPAQYQVEVQGVLNTNIFSAYSSAMPVALPVTIDSSHTTIASIDTIQVLLTLQASNIDPQTHKKPVTTQVTTVRLNNCSQAAIGYQMSCQ